MWTTLTPQGAARCCLGHREHSDRKSRLGSLWVGVVCLYTSFHVCMSFRAWRCSSNRDRHQLRCSRLEGSPSQDWDSLTNSCNDPSRHVHPPAAGSSCSPSILKRPRYNTSCKTEVSRCFDTGDIRRKV